MMTKAQQTFTNGKDKPIYVSIEPAPECYELEPGETITLIYDALNEEGDVLTINIIDEGLVVLPSGPEPEVLINGQIAESRSWKFKYT